MVTKKDPSRVTVYLLPGQWRWLREEAIRRASADQPVNVSVLLQQLIAREQEAANPK